MTSNGNAPTARRLTGAISLLVALSALAVLAGGLTTSPPAWLLIMFEGLALMGCAFGILFGFGRFRAAPQMTILCVGGTILAATAFGPVSVRWSLHGVSLVPLIIGRLLLVLVLALIAGAVALGDYRPAWRRVGKGGVLFVLFMLGAAGGWWVLVRSGFTVAVHGVVTVAFSIVLYLVLTGLLAGAVHMIVTAFADALEQRRREALGAASRGGGSPTTGHEPA